MAAAKKTGRKKVTRKKVPRKKGAEAEAGEATDGAASAEPDAPAKKPRGRPRKKALPEAKPKAKPVDVTESFLDSSLFTSFSVTREMQHRLQAIHERQSDSKVLRTLTLVVEAGLAAMEGVTLPADSEVTSSPASLSGGTPPGTTFLDSDDDFVDDEDFDAAVSELYATGAW